MRQVKEILEITVPKPEHRKISGDVGNMNVHKVEVSIYTDQTPENPKTRSSLTQAWITGEGLINLGFGFGVQDKEAWISDVFYLT